MQSSRFQIRSLLADTSVFNHSLEPIPDDQNEIEKTDESKPEFEATSTLSYRSLKMQNSKFLIRSLLADIEETDQPQQMMPEFEATSTLSYRSLKMQNSKFLIRSLLADIEKTEEQQNMATAFEATSTLSYRSFKMQSSKFLIRSLLADTGVINHSLEPIPADINEIEETEQPQNMTPQFKAYSSEPHMPEPATNTRLTYSDAIASAIRSSSEKRLPLQDIYKWIEENCPQFPSNNDNWKDTVRHNLSHNKLFVRVPRPANNPGRGKFWTIAAARESKIRNRNKIPVPASRKTAQISNQHNNYTTYPTVFIPAAGQFGYMTQQFVQYPNNYYSYAYQN